MLETIVIKEGRRKKEEGRRKNTRSQALPGNADPEALPQILLLNKRGRARVTSVPRQSLGTSKITVNCQLSTDYNKPAFSYKSRMILMIFCPYCGSEFQRAASWLTVGATPRLTKRKRTFSLTKG